MIRVAFAAAIFISLLSGCASHRASTYNISGNETFIGWNDQRKLPSDAYYVLLEGDAEGKTWKINEIYSHPISGRSNELQEVLFIDKEFRYVQPYFQINESTIVQYGEGFNSTKMTPVGRSNRNGDIVVTGMDFETTSSYLDRGSWECGAIIQANKDKYTACTTRLTKTDIGRSIGKNIFAVALTLGLMSGTHQVVDKGKIAEILVQTDLFERIKASKVYSQAGNL